MKRGSDPTDQNEDQGCWQTARRRFVQGTAAGTVLAVLRPQAAFAQDDTSSNMSSGGSHAALTRDRGPVAASASFWEQNTDLWHPTLQPNDAFDAVVAVHAALAVRNEDGLAGFFPMASLSDAIAQRAQPDQRLVDRLANRTKRRGAAFEVSSSGSRSPVRDVGHAGGWHSDRDEAHRLTDQGLRSLGRQVVASLQNAASTLPFDLTVQDVCERVRQACADSVAEGSAQPLEVLAAELRELNERPYDKAALRQRLQRG